MKKSLYLSLYLVILVSTSSSFANTSPPTPQCQNDIGPFAEIHEKSQALEAMRPGNTTERDLRPNSQSILSEFTGIPSGTRKLQATKNRIWRFFAPKDSLEQIKKDGFMLPSFTHYEVVSPGLRYIYNDLTGFFLTTKEFSATTVGRKGMEDWIDIEIPESLPVFEINAQLGIFLVPAPKRYQDWLIKDLSELRKTGIYPTGYSSKTYLDQLLEENVDTAKPVHLPVSIVDSSVDSIRATLQSKKD